MKKLMVLRNIFIVLGLVLLNTMCAADALAATGDVAGEIYATDIKTVINGVQVDSYNIGGRTVVIVEDITDQFTYSDALRTLIINDLSPERLAGGGNAYNQKPGTPVGKIYKTDIKTFFRGKELTGYSLNGKMAIVIEELGADNAFSDIGGKFVWNPDNRTISVESAYRYPYEMRSAMEDKNYNIILTYLSDALIANPVSAPLDGGNILCETKIPDNSMIPVKYNNDIIGYRCMFSEKIIVKDENGAYSLGERQTPVDYFYTDKVEAMIDEAGEVRLTAQDWLNYFHNHTLMNVKDSFETDNYVFLYSFFAGTHGGSETLIKLNKADGTRIDYDDNFESVSLYGQKYFENVRIDKENEKVYLHYDADYVIDLKTDEIKPL